MLAHSEADRDPDACAELRSFIVIVEPDKNSRS